MVEEGAAFFAAGAAEPLAEGRRAGEGFHGEGEALYDKGWTYEASQNAVVFWGTAVPDYNADVQIYYRPLDGQPRVLPF